ncbi:phage head closure protein [Rouxiella badensis]|uniref:Phage head closure protein n=1 Tax=Rouxiella silvae TaxID=1646373 RepID=A0AA40X3J4_9GAMM|nr:MULTISPECIES: phage head closure protein [Rouxiella]MBF6637900.1 phage head closure protein [Rouxiella silvae]MCC3735458.1 phage head closure protein [Rouxiella badensis]MCC3760755.1 phage head closure protein [Rouxiella badensis]
MEPGRFRHRVIIQNATTVKSPSGQPIEVWVDSEPVSAEVKAISGSELMNSGAELAEAKYRVWMRYRDDIESTSRLKFRGKIYEITSPPMPNAKFNRLEILCGTGVKQ